MWNGTSVEASNGETNARDELDRDGNQIAEQVADASRGDQSQRQMVVIVMVEIVVIVMVVEVRQGWRESM